VKRSSIVTCMAVLGVFLFFQAVPARADKFAGEFLRLGVGARALGMGEAFVAVADDASASYWNPAGLVFLPERQILFMHAEQFGDAINHDFISFAMPLEGQGVLSVGVIRLGVDNIPVTSEIKPTPEEDVGSDGNPDTEDKDGTQGNGKFDPGEPFILRLHQDEILWKSDSEYAILFSYAKRVNERLSLGGNFKLITQRLLGLASSFGMGLDAGVLYEARHDFTLGMKVADLTTTRLFWDTGARETIRPSVIPGVQFTREIPSLDGVLTGAFDVRLTFDGKDGSQFESDTVSADLRPGVEYWFRKTLAARFGASGSRITAGFGVRYGGFGADYAFVGHEELDNSHRVSLSVDF
jgi:hypothetical protein